MAGFVGPAGVALAGDKPQRYVLLSGLLAVDGRIDNVTRAR